ncbi:MAG: hypothetical protein IIU08_02145, partial [Clostridia bacterium]|nr:hypothetical protein [Clostridia bacterium]
MRPAPHGGDGSGIARPFPLRIAPGAKRDVLLFPTMKPLDMPKKEDKPVTPAAPVAEEKIDF